MRMSLTLVISRPRAEVFAYLVDPTNLPDWQRGVDSVRIEGDGSSELGTRFLQSGTFLGIRLESTLEIAELELDQLLTVRAVSGPVRLRVRHALDDAAGGTRLTVELEAEPDGPLPLPGPLLARAVERKTRSDFAKLRRVLEAG